MRSFATAVLFVITLLLVAFRGVVSLDCSDDFGPWLEDEIQDTAEEIQEISVFGIPIRDIQVLFWIWKVRPHGDWDYKNNKFEDCFYVNLFGTEYFRDVPGNVAYGYTGRVLFDEATLLAGAHGAQILHGIASQTLDLAKAVIGGGFDLSDLDFDITFDDPCDQNAVRVGMAVYEGKDLECMLECYGDDLNRKGSSTCTSGEKFCFC
eukprot:TRINITY_DN940_c0_g1_i1.p2 TRINITY_DN940_c0_g1~~TRINITY_DN940_c0_g1_i1.p2  ORF type:complete len:207 (-),score=31.05 TRINITY_DN940_c0_g1_i1:1048-1668(-)